MWTWEVVIINPATVEVRVFKGTNKYTQTYLCHKELKNFLRHFDMPEGFRFRDISIVFDVGGKK